MDMTDNELLPVKLKGVGGALRVTLDPTQPMEILKKELSKLFERLKHLAINARVVIDPGEPDGHEMLIQELGDYLKESFSVGWVSGPPQKKSEDEEDLRTRDVAQSFEHHRSDVLFLSGRVRSGQKVHARKHLIILGDVNPGAEIVAGGDVMIMGRLYGSVSAGQPASDESIVLAFDFKPSLLQIGNMIAAGSLTVKGDRPEFAHIENGELIVDDYLSMNPFSKMPWPKTR